MSFAAAVIIPHYNDPARLATCLDALAAQAGAHPEVEVVVVDNASPCDLAPLKARFPFVRFVTEPAPGAAAARNRGVAATTAAQIAFLDCDCVPSPDWLDRVRALESRPGAIGGRIDTFDETPPPRSGPEAFETVFAFDQKSYVEKKGFSVTANLVTRRAVFEDVGPLVVGLSEDMDWCFRATAKGHPLAYDDTLRVGHPTRSDWPALVRKWRRMTDEQFHLNGRSTGARLRWTARAVAVAASGPVHVGRVLRHPRLDGATERRGAVAVLLRLRALRAGWMLRQAVAAPSIGPAPSDRP
jgi:GT2 family glycosyltransferase